MKAFWSVACPLSSNVSSLIGGKLLVSLVRKSSAFRAFFSLLGKCIMLGTTRPEVGGDEIFLSPQPPSRFCRPLQSHFLEPATSSARGAI